MDRLLLNMFALVAIMLLSCPDECEGLPQRVSDYLSAKQTDIMDVDQSLTGDMDALPANRGEPEEGEVFYRREFKDNVLRNRSVERTKESNPAAPAPAHRETWREHDKLEPSMLMLVLH